MACCYAPGRRRHQHVTGETRPLNNGRCWRCLVTPPHSNALCLCASLWFGTLVPMQVTQSFMEIEQHGIGSASPARAEPFCIIVHMQVEVTKENTLKHHWARVFITFLFLSNFDALLIMHKGVGKCCHPLQKIKLFQWKSNAAWEYTNSYRQCLICYLHKKRVGAE